VLLSSAVTMRQAHADYSADQASPLHGTWDVTSFVLGGRELASTTEPSRWRRMSAANGAFRFRLEDDTHVNCSGKPDDAKHTFDLTCAATHQDGSLHWTRDGKQLRLDGSFAGQPLAARLALRDDSELPLLKAEFRWTYE
jgi:hypothetical protein